MSEAHVDDVRQRNAFSVQGRAAVSSQVVVDPSGDAGAGIERGLGLGPTLKAAFAGTEHESSLSIPLRLAPGQNGAGRIRQRHVTRHIHFGARGGNVENASIVDLVPAHPTNLAEPAE